MLFNGEKFPKIKILGGLMTPDVVELARRMLENGATRQQVADVIGVGVKTIYKYFPAQCSQSN